MILSAERRRALAAKAESYAANIDKAEQALLERGISLQVAEMFRLGLVPEGQEYAGRLAIPYYTPTGVVAIKYRCLSHASAKDCKEAGHPKYGSESGCGVHLFNAQVLINSSDLVVVTEGELDAVCVQAYCGIAAVAYPGVDTWKKQPHWRHCFEGVTEVVVVADGDDTGREAAKRVAESIGMHARVVDLPNGFDSNSYIAERGAAAFQEKIQ